MAAPVEPEEVQEPERKVEYGDPDPVEPVGEEISLEEFKKIDLRVCRVLKCVEIRKAHSCYKITLFDGIQERVIVSTLKKYYKPEELIGRKIIVVANLKPARLMGVRLHRRCHGSLFLLRDRCGEVQKTKILLLLYGIQEQVEPGPLFLVQQQPVYIFEKCSLEPLEIFRLISVDLLGDLIQFRVQLLQGVRILGELLVKQAHSLLLLLVQPPVHLPVPHRAQFVGIFRGAVLKPVPGKIQPVLEVFIFIRRPDLGKHSLQHFHIKVHNGPQLHQMGHGHQFDLLLKHQAALHNILFQGYEFIGIKGSTGKMSGSTGLNLTPDTLLKIYQPEIILWLYAKSEPNKAFDFCFDDGILRQYFEFDRQLDLEYLLRDNLAGLIAAPGAGVVLSAGLKVHLLILPAHGPVNLPGQLAVIVCAEVMHTPVTAFAHIVRPGTVLRERRDLRGIPAAFRAVDAHRIVRLPLSLLGVLGSETVQNVKDLPPREKGKASVLLGRV